MSRKLDIVISKYDVDSYLALNDVRVGVEQVLNLFGRDVLSAAHYDVFQAAHDPAVPVRADGELVPEWNNGF